MNFGIGFHLFVEALGRLSVFLGFENRLANRRILGDVKDSEFGIWWGDLHTIWALETDNS